MEVHIQSLGKIIKSLSVYSYRVSTTTESRKFEACLEKFHAFLLYTLLIFLSPFLSSDAQEQQGGLPGKCHPDNYVGRVTCTVILAVAPLVQKSALHHGSRLETRGLGLYSVK